MEAWQRSKLPMVSLATAVLLPLLLLADPKKQKNSAFVHLDEKTSNPAAYSCFHIGIGAVVACLEKMGN